MSEVQNEQFFDLLTKKAIYGLDEAEQRELDRLDPGNADDELFSLELAAAAISLTDVADNDLLPASLAAKIEKDSGKYVGAPWPPPYKEAEETRSSGWFGWLGWGAAVAACVVLVVNLFFTRFQPIETANLAPTPTPTPRQLAPSEQRQQFLDSGLALIRANWAAGNVKDLKDVSGDIVWSDAKQQGYMRFRGLPVNDRAKETYQLWIFDKTQDKATPIDGGVFDVNSDGEVIIPIDAKLTASEPAMFAITIEKPGGVVVSKREKVAALATVETKAG